MNEVRISKFMSLVLRHEPQALGIELDSAGWTDFEDFTHKMTERFGISKAEIKGLVANSPKQRFVIENGRIRANQGHSIEVDLALQPTVPPDILYHGTTAEAWKGIETQGLLKQQRTHVHLSPDIATAEIVAKRRKGPWVVLAVAAGQMSKAENKFFISANSVWLVDHVPAKFVTIEKQWGNL